MPSTRRNVPVTTMQRCPLRYGEVPLHGLGFSSRGYPCRLSAKPGKTRQTAADQFWSRAADDARISAQFRAICVDNLHTVRKTVGLLGGRSDSARTM
jgi:hypothetical protein